MGSVPALFWGWQTMSDRLHGKVCVNREALRDLLRRVDPGGFQSNALGIRFAPDRNGISTIPVEDDHVHAYIDRALPGEPGPLLVCACGSVARFRAGEADND